MTHPLKNYQGRVTKLLMYYTITKGLTTLWEQAQINELVHQTVSCWVAHMVWARHKATLCLLDHGPTEN